MTQHVQELINKIKHDGLEAGRQEAARIEAEAQARAKKVVAEAAEEARRIVEVARAEETRLRQAGQAALTQAGRDTLLSLRREIEAMLGRIVRAKLSEALSGDRLAAVIREMVAGSAARQQTEGVDIRVALKDYDGLKNTVLDQLRKDVTAGVTLSAAEDIHFGFTISFDQGRSYFDFSDASLTAFVSRFLNAELAALLNNQQPG